MFPRRLGNRIVVASFGERQQLRAERRQRVQRRGGGVRRGLFRVAVKQTAAVVAVAAKSQSRRRESCHVVSGLGVVRLQTGPPGGARVKRKRRRVRDAVRDADVVRDDVFVYEMSFSFSFPVGRNLRERAFVVVVRSRSRRTWHRTQRRRRVLRVKARDATAVVVRAAFFKTKTDVVCDVFAKRREGPRDGFQREHATGDARFSSRVQREHPYVAPDVDDRRALADLQPVLGVALVDEDLVVQELHVRPRHEAHPRAVGKQRDVAALEHARVGV